MNARTTHMAAALVAAVLAVCGSAGEGAAQGAPARGGHAHAIPHDSVHRPWTQADVHFMSGMIGHHAQAIVMSRMAPTHAASPAVKRLAERIINAQQDEIATMQQWLRDRGQPVPEARPGMMVMNGHVHEMHMPGMLTDEQMKRLDEARGAAFDELFLTSMIQHHRGATAMVKQLFGTHGAGQDETVFKFASDVNVDQTTEIARMESMLVEMLFGSGK